MSQADLSCPFCSCPTERVIAENEVSIAILDAYPVTNSHSLVIPKRHVSSLFHLTDEELLGCHSLIDSIRSALLESDDSILGFNVGVNVGEAAGQTVFHCHFHLIPRRANDVENPRGGVRNVIPGKGGY